MHKSIKGLLVAGLTASTLAACVDAGASHKANVFSQSGINQQQELKTVRIISAQAGKVEVDNSRNKQAAQTVGAIFGALAGAYASNRNGGYYTGSAAVAGGATGSAIGGLVGNTKLVDGVQLRYVFNGRALQSAQVGKMCEFALGEAYLVTSHKGETRIQPNSASPCEKGKEDVLGQFSSVTPLLPSINGPTHTDNIESIEREQELEAARNSLERTKLSGDRTYTERKREAARAGAADRQIENELNTHEALNEAIINRSQKDTTVIVK